MGGKDKFRKRPKNGGLVLPGQREERKKQRDQQERLANDGVGSPGDVIHGRACPLRSGTHMLMQQNAITGAVEPTSAEVNARCIRSCGFLVDNGRPDGACAIALMGTFALGGLTAGIQALQQQAEARAKAAAAPDAYRYDPEGELPPLARKHEPDPDEKF